MTNAQTNTSDSPIERIRTVRGGVVIPYAVLLLAGGLGTKLLYGAADDNTRAIQSVQAQVSADRGDTKKALDELSEKMERRFDTIETRINGALTWRDIELFMYRTQRLNPTMVLPEFPR